MQVDAMVLSSSSTTSTRTSRTNTLTPPNASARTRACSSRTRARSEEHARGRMSMHTRMLALGRRFVNPQRSANFVKLFDSSGLTKARTEPEILVIKNHRNTHSCMNTMQHGNESRCIIQSELEHLDRLTSSLDSRHDSGLHLFVRKKCYKGKGSYRNTRSSVLFPLSSCFPIFERVTQTFLCLVNDNWFTVLDYLLTSRVPVILTVLQSSDRG